MNDDNDKNVKCLLLRIVKRTYFGNSARVYNGKANRDADGNITSLSGTIQDIDRRKKAQLKYDEEKQKSIHSAKLASLGELAASMAHEINNPVGIISGNAELLKLTLDLDEKSLTKLDVILKSCEG